MTKSILETLIVIFSLSIIAISFSQVGIGKVWLIIFVLILIAMSLSPLFMKKMKDLDLLDKEKEED